VSKAVLISIRPKWCEKIASGDKTIEVRKTRPKMDTPFKCYIYCTLQGCNELFRVGLGRDVAKWNRGKWGDRKGNVIGEFTCDRIDWITHVGYTGIPNLVETCICDATTMRTSPVGGLFNAACLTPKMLNDYLARGDGYGWHITDLHIYDTPRDNPPTPLETEGFTLVETREVRDIIHLSCNEDIQALFRMTPYYYKTGARDQAKAAQAQELDVKLAFGLAIYQKD